MNLPEVQAWLIEVEKQLDLSGIETFTMRVSAKDVLMSGWQRWRFETVTAPTIEAAHEALREKFPLPENLVRQKREDARRLLREASELEATL